VEAVSQNGGTTEPIAGLDALVARQERQREAEEAYEVAVENYARTDRERVAVGREASRVGWADFWRRSAAMHYGMAEEAMAKAEMYEGMKVPNLPANLPPHLVSRNGHG
jgi:hypothetical protein